MLYFNVRNEFILNILYTFVELETMTCDIHSLCHI
jgi:hypothetical protein